MYNKDQILNQFFPLRSDLMILVCAHLVVFSHNFGKYILQGTRCTLLCLSPLQCNSLFDRTQVVKSTWCLFVSCHVLNPSVDKLEKRNGYPWINPHTLYTINYQGWMGNGEICWYQNRDSQRMQVVVSRVAVVGIGTPHHPKRYQHLCHIRQLKLLWRQLLKQARRRLPTKVGPTRVGHA